MRIPIIGRFIDERFLDRRRRSTSVAGMAGILAAYGLFMYHLLFDHTIDWELFAIVAIIAVTKIILMTWYLLRD